MSLVDSFTHLKGRPKADDALSLLQRLASLVKPVMRKHSWKLPVLAEFFPNEPSLLGLNMNCGQKILLRLRPPSSPDTFYHEEQLVSVLLHELTHNVHGPHDEKFYKFLSDLEVEYDTLRRTGYNGEGFHSAGKRLGVGMSHNLPPHLARAKALQSAEKRRTLQNMLGSSGGQRLGGHPAGISTNMSPRELAAQAAERRARDEKLCGTRKDFDAQKEVEKAALDSVENRASALQDMPNSSESRFADGALGPSASGIKALCNDEISCDAGWSCAVCTLENLPAALRCLACLSARPIGSSKHPRNTGASLARSIPPASSSSSRGSKSGTCTRDPKLVGQEKLETSWTCPACTLLNLDHFLQCSVCATIRPKRTLKDSWTCMACGEDDMPHDFWSCRFCGRVKDSSAAG